MRELCIPRILRRLPSSCECAREWRAASSLPENAEKTICIAGGGGRLHQSALPANVPLRRMVDSSVSRKPAAYAPLPLAPRSGAGSRTVVSPSHMPRWLWAAQRVFSPLLLSAAVRGIRVLQDHVDKPLIARSNRSSYPVCRPAELPPGQAVRAAGSAETEPGGAQQYYIAFYLSSSQL